MTEENKEPVKDDEFINKDVAPVEEEYLQVSQQAAVREVEMPKEGEKVKTLTESMDDATDLTDMQFAAANLFPKEYNRRQAMVARVAPEAFLALLHIMVTDAVMAADPVTPINVNDEIFKAYYILTTGLDGRGRIDYAELLGAAKEIKKEESLLKGL